MGAFTLIELLVVIAIVAVLAGMLLPVLGLVKEAAKQSTCGNNQRQVILAVVAYATDNEGQTPYADTTTVAGATGQRYYYATLFEQDYLPREMVVAFHGGASPVKGAPSLRWPNVASCPSFKPLQNPTPANGTNTTYSVRWSWLQVPGEIYLAGGSALLARLSSGVPFIADSVRTAAGGPPYLSLGYSPGYWSTSVVNDARLYLVHGRSRAMAAYADGHVAARGQAQLLGEGINANAIYAP
ncbi:MAG: type II secretion system GspH family protein [Planctomycetes bacterium]|nr:type II secretion system GspH family protein [Planctomycetota bacterium]